MAAPQVRNPRSSSWRVLVSACSIVALTLGSAFHAHAQETETPAPQPSSPVSDEDSRRIVVIGNRTIVAALEDVEPEQTYDEDAVASYNVSTIGELLDEIRGENGDDQTEILVNGQPARDPADIADLPVEAIERIEQLPRGSAQRIGGGAGQRAYNVVLKRSVRSLTMTVSREAATEGAWGRSRAEALVTLIRDRDRINLTLRGADSDMLFEADRDIVPREERFPFSRSGNAIPLAGSEVDPALSALVGQPVTVVALPGHPDPTLADLVAGANRANPSEQVRYRTLRGATRPYEAAISGNKTLTPELSLSFNGRLGWNRIESLRGLPTGRFLLPAGHPASPFSTSVVLAYNDPARPLQSINESSSKSVSATLNGNFGSWHTAVLARYDERDSTFVSELTGSFPGGGSTVDSATNPFAGGLAGQIPVTMRTSTSETRDRQITANADGPLFDLPSGPVLARLGAGALWTGYEAFDLARGERSLDRREFSATAGVTIPLTGGTVLPPLGSSELAFDYGHLDLGRFGSIDSYSVALNWNPMDWLRLTASEVKEGRAIHPALLAAPVVETEGVLYFDPLTNESVEVTLISGGVVEARNPTTRTRSLSVSATPLRKYNLQLNADYQELQLRNQLGALPLASPAVVAAFPERFERDATGQLVVVDTTTVNFERQSSNQLRLGIGVRVPMTQSRTIPRTEDSPMRRVPGTNLQVNLSHTVVFDSTTVIREGLPEVDLLAGGAFGVGGAQTRNSTNGSLSLTRGGTGFRLTGTYRGPSYLQTGGVSAQDRLTFHSLLRFDLRMFADLGQLMPGADLAKGTRLSLVFDNVFNERQRVTNSGGVTPQAYQPAYRDPVGRTVMVELRKVF